MPNLRRKWLRSKKPFDGAYVGRKPVISPVIFIAVYKYVARGAFRARTAASQYMTAVQPNLL